MTVLREPGKSEVRRLATINYSLKIDAKRFYRLRVLREVTLAKSRYQTYLVYVVREVLDEEDL